MLTQSWSFAVINKAPHVGRINREVRHRRKMATVGTPILRKADGTLAFRAVKNRRGNVKVKVVA